MHCDSVRKQDENQLHNNIEPVEDIPVINDLSQSLGGVEHRRGVNPQSNKKCNKVKLLVHKGFVYFK